jgi:hypothetical protein
MEVSGSPGRFIPRERALGTPWILAALDLRLLLPYSAVMQLFENFSSDLILK